MLIAPSSSCSKSRKSWARRWPRSSPRSKRHSSAASPPRRRTRSSSRRRWILHQRPGRLRRSLPRSHPHRRWPRRSPRSGTPEPRSAAALAVPSPLRTSNTTNTLVAGVRTVAALVAVGTYVLVFGPPALLWTVLSRDPRLSIARAVGRPPWIFWSDPPQRHRDREPPSGRGLRLQSQQQHRAAGCLHGVASPVSSTPRCVKPSLKRRPRLGVRRCRVCPARAGNPEQSRPAIDRAAQDCAKATRLSFSRRHPEPDRRTLPFKKAGS